MFIHMLGLDTSVITDNKYCYQTFLETITLFTFFCQIFCNCLDCCPTTVVYSTACCFSSQHKSSPTTETKLLQRHSKFVASFECDLLFVLIFRSLSQAKGTHRTQQNKN